MSHIPVVIKIFDQLANILIRLELLKLLYKEVFYKFIYGYSDTKIWNEQKANEKNLFSYDGKFLTYFQLKREDQNIIKQYFKKTHNHILLK